MWEDNNSMNPFEQDIVWRMTEVDSIEALERTFDDGCIMCTLTKRHWQDCSRCAINYVHGVIKLNVFDEELTEDDY